MSVRPVVVTGAAGFLGVAVCATLAERGLAVIGVDLALAAPGADRMARFIGGIDLTDETSAAKIAQALGDAPLYGFANIAGGFAWETVAGGVLATWDRLYAMNVRTAFIATRALLPAIRTAQGAIANVSASGSGKAEAGMGPYAASKAGVARLTGALAAELKDDGVRVNAVIPSIIDTPANRADMPDADPGRWVAPAALADVIAFLLSDAARAVTGALLPVVGRV